jgi:prepilin-type N-terminal cleavage/methylation domain-containing protein
MKTDRKRKKNKNKGFTLLELSIAMAIFSLLMMMAAPSLVSKMPLYRLRSAGRQLNAHLRMTRMKAMSTGQPMFVEFDAESGAYQIWADPQQTGRMSELETYDFKDLPGIIVSCYPQGGAFKPNGQFSGSADEDYNTLWIWLETEDGSAFSSVVVWPSGQVSIYNYSTS